MKPGPLKYHGGKSYLASRLIKLMPPHKRYGDGTAGSLAVLWAKPCEGVAEFVNDLNGELINFWRVLQDPVEFQVFQRFIQAVPFGEPSFLEKKRKTSAGRAVHFFTRNRQSRQGLGKDFATPTKRTRRGMNENVSAWLTAVDGLPEFHERLRRVEIRSQPVTEFIEELDWQHTLFYLDPPYLGSERTGGGEYGEFEMTYEDHEALLETLVKIKGKFLLSGYPTTLYNRAAKAAGWRMEEFSVANSASSKRTKQRKRECVWMNF